MAENHNIHHLMAEFPADIIQIGFRRATAVDDTDSDFTGFEHQTLRKFLDQCRLIHIAVNSLDLADLFKKIQIFNAAKITCMDNETDLLKIFQKLRWDVLGMSVCDDADFHNVTTSQGHKVTRKGQRFCLVSL